MELELARGAEAGVPARERRRDPLPRGVALLSDEELFAMEDCVADFLEARAACDVVTAEIVHANAEVMGKLHKLVALSEGLAHDSMFARQLRRKFV